MVREVVRKHSRQVLNNSFQGTTHSGIWGRVEGTAMNLLPTVASGDATLHVAFRGSFVNNANSPK